jgi:type IV pilus assembly protein PilN
MIRVNLLPIKQARRRSAGRTQLGVFAALLLAEALVLGFLYYADATELEKLQQRVVQSQAEIAKAKAEVKDAQELRKEADRLTQQLNVLAELEKRRSGPVKVLDELQIMLSPPRNEEARFAQLQRNWNVEWDTRRLWIESFGETDGKFKMEGAAVNADDVAEFLQRLSTADHFDGVTLDFVKTRGVKDGSQVVDFKVMGNVHYGGKPEPKKDAKKGAGKGKASPKKG